MYRGRLPDGGVNLPRAVPSGPLLDPQSRLSRSTSSVELASVTRPQLTPPPDGVVALFSCTSDQQAYEHPDIGHGIFFYHVLQALEGAGDGNGDKRITLDELVAHAKTETAQFARLKLKAVQTPRQRGYFEGEWLLRDLGSKPEVPPTMPASPQPPSGANTPPRFPFGRT